jgi:hypothetical protein
MHDKNILSTRMEKGGKERTRLLFSKENPEGQCKICE